VKLSEGDEDGWHSLQTLGLQFEDCTTSNNVLKVCRVRSVDQGLDRHVTVPEEGEEIAEHGATLLDKQMAAP
jgi:hypothetical protein